MSDENKFKGWRRLIFAGIVLVSATVVLALGYIDGGDWRDLLGWLSATYIGSDGVEKVATAWQGRAQVPESTAPKLDENGVKALVASILDDPKAEKRGGG